jgi:preprotein translocase subunit SecA
MSDMSGPADLKDVFQRIASDAIADIVAKHATGRHAEEWSWPELRAEFGMAFLADIEVAPDDLSGLMPEDLVERMAARALIRFDERRQQLGDELFGNLLKAALLHTLDAKWRDHLYALDLVREGINLRAYGQKDPLIEYKQESFKMFNAMMSDYRREAITFLFRAETKVDRLERERREARQRLRAYKPEAAVGGDQPEPGDKPKPAAPARRTEQKVGRNDLCPCGSGRKYKKCCGKNV